MNPAGPYPVCSWIDERLAGGARHLPIFLRELAEHVETCVGCRWRVGQLLVRHLVNPAPGRPAEPPPAPPPAPPDERT